MGSGDLQFCLLRRQLPIAFLGPIWSLYLEAYLPFFPPKALLFMSFTAHQPHDPALQQPQQNPDLSKVPEESLLWLQSLDLPWKIDPDLSFLPCKMFH